MSHIMKTLAALLVAVGLLAGSVVCASAADEINTTFFGNTAVEGYDVVAYFKDGKPMKGEKKHQYEWKGAKWRFSSEMNRELFMASPEKYAPQYGGYCAYAVSQGTTAGIDPEAWKIVDGKLYLNLNKKIQARWEEDIPGYIEKADANWPGVLN